MDGSDVRSESRLYDCAYNNARYAEPCDRCPVEVERLREVLDGLAQAARWFSTEAEYKVAEAIGAEFVDALETAERLASDITALSADEEGPA